MVECNLAKVDVEGSSPFARLETNMRFYPTYNYILVAKEIPVQNDSGIIRPESSEQKLFVAWLLKWGQVFGLVEKYA